MKIWKIACLSDLYSSMNQSSFGVILLDNVLINADHLKKYKIAFSLETAVCKDMIFIWLTPAMKQLLEKHCFEFLHTLNFSCTWRNIKKLVVVGKLLWRFDNILHIWLIHLLFH